MPIDQAGDTSVVSSSAVYRGERGELHVAQHDVIFDFTARGVTIGFLTHAGTRVEYGSDWVEFDSIHGTFRFEQVADVDGIVVAAESLPVLQLAS